MCLPLHTFKPGESIRVIVCKTRPLHCFVIASFTCSGKPHILLLLIYPTTGLQHVLLVGKDFFVSFKVIIDFQVQHTDFIFPLPPLFQVAVSTPTFMWAFFPHPVAIHAHTKATFGADPVQVEDRGVTDVAHLANTTNRALPGHLSCGQQRDSRSVSANKIQYLSVTTVT